MSSLPQQPLAARWLSSLFSKPHRYQQVDNIEYLEMEAKPTTPPPARAVEDASDPDDRSIASEDKTVMAQMGKRQQLKRRFNIFSIFGLSMTLLSSWEAIGASIGLGMTSGGPVSLVYGLMFTFCGTLACAASIAEMASMCPISGAQYHWTYMFAPKEWRVFITFIQGVYVELGWGC